MTTRPGPPGGGEAPMRKLDRAATWVMSRAVTRGAVRLGPPGQSGPAIQTEESARWLRADGFVLLGGTGARGCGGDTRSPDDFCCPVCDPTVALPHSAFGFTRSPGPPSGPTSEG